MDKEKHAATKRLRRVEGQIRGIIKMIEEDRYCIDILNQMRAVKTALARAEDLILKNHVATCVETAIASGDPEEQREKTAELVDLLSKVKV